MVEAPDGVGAGATALARDALRPYAAGGHRPLLLAGPEGSRRLEAARWFARLANCATPGREPCGTCGSCTSFGIDDDGAVVAPDYREVRRGATTKSGRAARRPTIAIDQLVTRERGAVDPLGPWLAAPPRARRRIGVIVGADAMTEDAANAFLKTLEEPPSWAGIVLIAPGPEHLLATVASRCLVLRFPPLQTEGPQAGVAEAARGVLEALRGPLTEPLGALTHLKAATGDDDDALLDALRHAVRDAPGALRLAVEDATEDAADALGAYAHRDLTLLRLVLRLRAAAG